MIDAINPEHYKRLPAEAIEIIEAAIENAPSNQDAYLHGQVLKYVLRCWSKNGIEDLKKAKWYLDRPVDSLDEREKQKAADLQSLKDHPFGKTKWTPKIGDWVKINKQADPQSSVAYWWACMDAYHGQIVQVEKIKGEAIVRDDWAFLFDWLEPVEAPKATGEVTEEVTGEVTGEVKPPDGWRWLECGEVIRVGDNFWFENKWHDRESSAIGARYEKHHCQTIRRNHFAAFEKVVRITENDKVYEVIASNETGFAVLNGFASPVNVIELAPYIEDAK